MRPARLPRYMLAIRPQTKSFCSTNSSGPGCRPQIRRPPSSTAAVGEPGNAERQHRQQRARAGGVRRGFRRDHAFDLARAELVAVLRHPLGHAIAHERRGRRAAGRDAHPAADEAAAQRRQPVARQLLPRLQHDLRIDLRALARERQALLHRQQDLADAEEADHRDQEVEAPHQLGKAEGQPQLAGDGVHADRGEREAQHHRRERLERRALAHADEAAERQQMDREEFRRPELERELGDQRREERDHASPRTARRRTTR